MARIAGKQVAIFNTAEGIRACDNRCPHEGYPLKEGSVSDNCILTCNWHNWKFDLNSGDNLYGGDQLRTYPVQTRKGETGEEIWIDISDPPYEEQYFRITENLRHAFIDHSYDRIAREIARLSKLGADPFDAIRLSIQWSVNHLEFGWTHAYASMADWLLVYQEAYDDEEELKLLSLVECIAHTAFDVLREPEYPYNTDIRPFDEAEFLQAIEMENEPMATALVRGGLAQGLNFEDLEYALSFAALAHYNDFGHSLIYVNKAKELIQTLGQGVTEALVLSLVRHFIFASREDKIPEFRTYQPTLATWNNTDKGELTQKPNEELPRPDHWHKKGIKQSLETTLSFSHLLGADIYPALLEAVSNNMLNFDISQQYKTQITVSGNVNWLDFTHGLTFANAVRKQCERFPELWPQGLLQIACFVGRNAAFTTAESQFEDWQADLTKGNMQQHMSNILEQVFDHGIDEYIASVHWIKTALAAREEIELASAHTGQIIFAALNRFINSPLKRKQPRRTAYQSLQFVAKE